jgi:hypothetical protein
LFSIALRVEWAKAKARSDRWWEEVVLVDEEMRRTLQFCRWKENWWRQQVSLRPLDASEPILLEGLKAYAERQAALERSIYVAWETKWRKVRLRAEPILQGIPNGYGDEEFEGEMETIEIDIEDGEGEGYESDAE